ncbi:hypothetical protein DRV85_15935 [Rhodosalinus halophilus]|uniref:Class II aldolase/adducin N-terminal domain-containing protein n=1 Tax=Rhodosalinus halophilus TaxID=2259333 RepID=A0A365U537_9RHOB|nr:class II aldolase/adducin family protein [Rhodosalinus halophilus]RBI83412.1 hypothetical protein DRV85_15935 [Rhodosalinus halophilus]
MKDVHHDEKTIRAELAAALRWFDRLGMNEGIANHVSHDMGDGTFLLNPYGVHWSVIRASDLARLASDCDTGAVGDNIDPTAWAIHGAMHRHVPQARCVMHLHSRAGTALSCLADPTLPPIDQNAMRFFGRVAIDMGFDGMGLGDEAERLAGALGSRRILLMAQHGVLVVGDSVAQCLDDLYYFEKAADTYLLALATGRALNIASAEIAEKTARQWEAYPGFAARHLAAIRQVLDAEGAEYAA